MDRGGCEWTEHAIDRQRTLQIDDGVGYRWTEEANRWSRLQIDGVGYR